VIESCDHHLPIDLTHPGQAHAKAVKHGLQRQILATKTLDRARSILRRRLKVRNRAQATSLTTLPETVVLAAQPVVLFWMSVLPPKSTW